MKKNTILKGTLILTLAGLITRIIGFFYKIYLSNTLGAEMLGIYQLVFPIYSICFTLYAGGIQTAISKLVAAECGNTKSRNISNILKVSLVCSVSIAFVLSILVYRNADYIANYIILEPSCKRSLEIISIVFPFCGITSCINGFYYGLKMAQVPATTQLLEQLVRVICVYVIALYMGNGNHAVTCELAVFGVVIGEIASNIYNITSLFISKKGLPHHINNSANVQATKTSILKPLFLLAIPLTANHLIISILHSFESILIPSMLKKSGLSASDALSIYGIFTGMSLPFILFPSTITNSLSVLLLPTVSEAHAKQNQTLITQTTSITIKYSLIIGIFSTGFFLLFGNIIGTCIFKNTLAGNFLVILSWLCPFLYLTTTLSSIINGLGKTHMTFFNTVIGLFIRILFVIYLVPTRGISGYLVGMLISQLSITLLDILSLRQTIVLSFDVANSLLKPILTLCILGFFSYRIFLYLQNVVTIPDLLLLFLVSFQLLLLYLISLILFGAIKREDLRIQ